MKEVFFKSDVAGLDSITDEICEEFIIDRNQQHVEFSLNGTKFYLVPFSNVEYISEIL